MIDSVYPVGTPGQPWGAPEKAKWLANQRVRRSYQDIVQSKLETLAQRADAGWLRRQYGALSYDPKRFPLWLFESDPWEDALPSVLISGGVHGYETSGVMGAIRFIEEHWRDYARHFNFVVMPCISPWGFETINRWNPLAIDPNRSFYRGSPAEESAAVLDYVSSRPLALLAHIDLHETTDTDNTEFRLALAARDGEIPDLWEIPDGFYAVGDIERPQPDFQAAIIRRVEEITHIAQPDCNHRLIGVDLEQPGVINYRARQWGLCAGMTGAQYVTTTEVYPDSSRVDHENCIQAQVTAILGGLDHILVST